MAAAGRWRQTRWLTITGERVPARGGARLLAEARGNPVAQRQYVESRGLLLMKLVHQEVDKGSNAMTSRTAVRDGI